MKKAYVLLICAIFEFLFVTSIVLPSKLKISEDLLIAPFLSTSAETFLNEVSFRNLDRMQLKYITTLKKLTKRSKDLDRYDINSITSFISGLVACLKLDMRFDMFLNKNSIVSLLDYLQSRAENDFHEIITYQEKRTDYFSIKISIDMTSDFEKFLAILNDIPLLLDYINFFEDYLIKTHGHMISISNERLAKKQLRNSIKEYICIYLRLLLKKLKDFDSSEKAGNAFFKLKLLSTNEGKYNAIYGRYPYVGRILQDVLDEE